MYVTVFSASFSFGETTENGFRKEISAKFVRPPCSYTGLDFIGQDGKYLSVDQAIKDSRCPRLKDYSVPRRRQAARIAEASNLMINFNGKTRVIDNNGGEYTILNPTVRVNDKDIPIIKGSEYGFCKLFGHVTGIVTGGKSINFNGVEYGDQDVTVKGLKLGKRKKGTILEDDQAKGRPIRLIVCSVI